MGVLSSNYTSCQHRVLCDYTGSGRWRNRERGNGVACAVQLRFPVHVYPRGEHDQAVCHMVPATGFSRRCKDMTVLGSLRGPKIALLRLAWCLGVKVDRGDLPFIFYSPVGYVPEE